MTPAARRFLTAPRQATAAEREHDLLSVGLSTASQRAMTGKARDRRDENARAGVRQKGDRRG